MAELEKQKTEKQKKIEHEKLLKENDANKKNIIAINPRNINHTSGIKLGLGDLLEHDDNEIANIESIKLSEKMGKFNNLVQEGTASCRKLQNFY